jgi:hypothetical protein
MEHISLTHAQYTKAIRTVSVYLCVAAYKRYTQNKVYLKLCVLHICQKGLMFVLFLPSRYNFIFTKLSPIIPQYIQ